MDLPPLPLRAVAAAAAAVLAAGMVAAGVTAGSSDPDGVSASQAAATTVPGASDPAVAQDGDRAPDGGGEAPASGGGESASPGGGVEPNGPAPAAGDRSDAEPAARPAAPRAGIYRYHVVREEDGAETEEREDEVRVEDASRDGVVVRQRLHMDQSFGPAVSDIVWSPEGVRVEVTRFEALGGGECDWGPDMEWHRFPLDEGSVWEFESSCAMTMQGMSFDVRMTAQVSVGPRRTDDVAGQKVEVVEMRRMTTVEISGSGLTGSARTSDTELFAPERGLVTSSAGTWEADFAGDRRSGTSERRLLHLDPT